MIVLFGLDASSPLKRSCPARCIQATSSACEANVSREKRGQFVDDASVGLVGDSLLVLSGMDPLRCFVQGFRDRAMEAFELVEGRQSRGRFVGDAAALLG